MKDRIKKILKSLNEGVFEKEHILSMTLLSAMAGESIFLLGPPGTAKSMVARKLKHVFDSPTCFEYLMSRFSTPDEIFGPVSINRLKNDDVYERCIQGYLPTATVVFLDEIWKAGPAIQNALLTAINERIYQNGTETIHLPMKALIAASNELPKEDEGLEALWDRFLVRIVSNCINDEKTFYKMLRQKSEAITTIPEKLRITDEQYDTWQIQINDIEIPDDILKVITEIRAGLKKAADADDVSPLDYYVSDRRWKKSIHLLQTSAFLNGRKSIDLTDLYLLAHVLWNKVEGIPVIWDILKNSFFVDVDKKLEVAAAGVDKLYSDVLPGEVSGSESVFKVYDYFYYRLKDYAMGKCYIFQSDYRHLTNSVQDGVIYWDDSYKAFIIRRIDVNQPFASNSWSTGSNVKQVHLRKIQGGVMVNSQSYHIETTESAKAIVKLNKQDVEGVAVQIEDVKRILSDRMSLLTEGLNLFVPRPDEKTVKKAGESRTKRLAALEAKLAGLHPSE